MILIMLYIRFARLLATLHSVLGMNEQDNLRPTLGLVLSSFFSLPCVLQLRAAASPFAPSTAPGSSPFQAPASSVLGTWPRELLEQFCFAFRCPRAPVT